MRRARSGARRPSSSAPDREVEFRPPVGPNRIATLQVPVAKPFRLTAGARVVLRPLGQHHRELQARDYRYMKPGLQDEGERLELQVIDPFNNRIRFMELKG